MILCLQILCHSQLGGRTIMFNRFLTYLSVGLAVAAFFHGSVSTHILIGIIILTIVVCLIVERIFRKISNLNYDWTNGLFFLLDKNPNEFRLKDKVITFNIKSDCEAEYNVLANGIQVKKNSDNVIYLGRYNWPQEDDIKHVVKVNDEEINHDQYCIGQDIKWSTISILARGIIHKKQESKVEYTLENLYINNLKYHKFLSCKIIEKIDTLQLNIKIPKNLSSGNNASFIVQDSNGDVIHVEELQPVNGSNKYTKTVHKPRIGKKYIIKLN